ncbi:MAG TPA: sensor histidine kinase KdpD [Spirochaetota bacterium]|nr:sensor histidine kinase KdpD [Spirochaetota bacterium]HOD14225.1 sensor histidine kinase KdpD [Spirochaetota bacterium]HPG52415.1 sensor histidine kinase KdpD [Spirochaetota bacterium]HPN11401.1 sensor histidine kinase KdpD [Spirochaetota bacterium]
MRNGNQRPDPDSLLRSITDEEREKNRKGSRERLKIFFGMSAGVGKTYAMLEAAQQLTRDGVDVVIGYVETHGRAETDALAKGLTIIPRRKIDYRGLQIEEMDIDAILARKPAIVLVDELAHTNAVGSRHEKRYQDVIELLDAGIRVFTTLNIQHLESQADVAEKITGIRIRETLPDSILEIADEVELVDIPPEELLKRLAEGKVYVPDRAGLAAENFFRKGNITALREMALHYTARLVGYELRDYNARKNIKGPWKSGERLMVAVSPSPYSEYLIRWTRRIAFNLQAPWTALYIEKRRALSKSSQEILTRNLNLARELGAEVISTVDEDIIKGLVRTAQEKNITQIVVGKPLRRYLPDYFKGGSLVERLLKSSGDIEIHVVTRPDVLGEKSRIRPGRPSMPSLRGYLIGATAVSAVTLANLPLIPVTGYWTVALIYLFCVVMLSLFIGRGPVFLSATLSALLWNFLFIPPRFTFRIGKLEDGLMFGMYFIIALILGGLTSRLRMKEWALRTREQRMSALLEFSKVLDDAPGIEDVISASIRYSEDNLDARAAILLADGAGGLSVEQHPADTLTVSAKEHAIAEWVFKNRTPAGLYTNTLPNADAHYLPLIAPGTVVGVMGIAPRSGAGFTPDQEDLLKSVISQLATRIERENLSKVNQKALLATESERLYKILLNSISHEIRTPLTTITGASSGLLDDAIETRPETRRELALEINRASERLNRLVENLLDMSRLESGMLKPNIQLHDIGDLASVVLRRLENELTGHQVRISIPDDMPLVPVDFSLMEQVLCNLVYNAVNYTPPGSEIRLTASRTEDVAVIAVQDTGPGLDPADIPLIFDKFHRGSKTSPGGTGIGLSICRGIVEVHGGSIRAGNRREGGAEFIITLPLQPASDRKGGMSA